MDDFLKEMIQIMDKVKETLFQSIENYTGQFTGYYQAFGQKVDEFLQYSVETIRTYFVD